MISKTSFPGQGFQNIRENLLDRSLWQMNDDTISLYVLIMVLVMILEAINIEKRSMISLTVLLSESHRQQLLHCQKYYELESPQYFSCICAPWPRLSSTLPAWPQEWGPRPEAVPKRPLTVPGARAMDLRKRETLSSIPEATGSFVN